MNHSFLPAKLIQDYISNHRQLIMPSYSSSTPGQSPSKKTGFQFTRVILCRDEMGCSTFVQQEHE